MPRLQPVAWLALVVLVAGCAGRLSPPPAGIGAPAPEVAVERFLQLAAAREYLQMGWVFGTAEGPVLRRDPAPEVEQRMYALAAVLENGGYTVGRGEAVPGRVGAAQRFDVVLRQGGGEVVVPLVVVRGGGGRWLVEQVDVPAVTGRR